MITKAAIATMLGVTTATIDDNIYTWALAQFYALTGLTLAATTKNYRKHHLNSTTTIKLNDINISSITSIKVDNTAKVLTANSDYFVNPDTGNIKFASSLSGFIEIAYTTLAYTDKDIYSYLVAMLVYKGMYIFNPAITNEVKSITIGKFSKSFGTRNFLEDLEVEILRTRDLALGDNGAVNYGELF